MDKTKQPARFKALNRYIKKRFGFAYRVNGYIAKYLLACRSNQQLAACLREVSDEIGAGKCLQLGVGQCLQVSNRHRAQPFVNLTIEAEQGRLLVAEGAVVAGAGHNVQDIKASQEQAMQRFCIGIALAFFIPKIGRVSNTGSLCCIGLDHAKPVSLFSQSVADIQFLAPVAPN